MASKSDPLWLPTRFTQPLSPDFVTDGDKLIQFAELVWTTPELEDGFTLDPWQADLIRRVLERYPDDWHDQSLAGRLRYRQVVISIPRQQGKSVLGAIFSLYGLLMHVKGPTVIGIASSVDQAAIVYKRTMLVINSNPALRRRFAKTTETRGIATADGRGTYQMKASKGAALQGIPVSLAIFDELHICSPDLWTALVMGTAQRTDGIIIGITTAGDDSSVLLKDLYEAGAGAINGDNERFGFFVWEAPEGANTDDPDAVLGCNPSIVCGRMSLDQVMSDLKTLPEADRRRYRLNQFVSQVSNFIDPTAWHQAGSNEPIPDGRVVFGIDRSPKWGYATITAAVKHEGTIYTEVVATLNSPTIEQLQDYAIALAGLSPYAFAVDQMFLGELAGFLKSKGLIVYSLNNKEMASASEMSYAKTIEQTWIHKNDELVNSQIRHAAWSYGATGQGRVSKKDSKQDIDALVSSIMAMYVCELMSNKNYDQIF